MSVLELRRFVPTVIEGADDWRATGCLHAEHSRALRPDPSHLFHFVKGLPHADEARASARRIEDHVRQFPIKLLGQLVSHRLLAFDAIRLLQSRNVEPAFALFAAGHLGAAIGDQAVNQRDARAELLALDPIGGGGRARSGRGGRWWRGGRRWSSAPWGGWGWRGRCWRWTCGRGSTTWQGW